MSSQALDGLGSGTKKRGQGGPVPHDAKRWGARSASPPYDVGVIASINPATGKTLQTFAALTETEIDESGSRLREARYSRLRATTRRRR